MDGRGDEAPACYATASSIDLAILVRCWLFRVIEKDSQIVRAASRRTRGSDQSAGPKVWAACLPPRTDATKEPSSASVGVITTS